MMKLRRNNFTAPVPVGPSSAQPAVKPERHEFEMMTRAFRINYAILCVALLPVTVAIAALLEFDDAFIWLLLYGVCCLGAYYWLHGHYHPAPIAPAAPPIQPLRVVEQPNPARAVEQLQRHGQPQSHSNRLANYVPVTDDEVTQFDREELSLPAFMADEQTIESEAYIDMVRDAVLNLLITLYKKDEGGALLNIKPDGTLQDGIIVPWSKRGGLTEGQRRQALDLLDQVRTVGGWLIRYDDALRKWKLNVALYSTFDAACDILDKCPTRVA